MLKKSRRREIYKFLVFGFSFILFFFQGVLYPSFAQTLTYTKQQVFFLHWGDKDNEIGLKDLGKHLRILKSGNQSPSKNFNEEKDIASESAMFGNKEVYEATSSYGIDGDGNIYILDGNNKKLKVFNQNGELIRSLELEKPFSDFIVDEDGDIYFQDFSNDFRKHDVVRIKKDNTKIIYQNTELGEVHGGIIYSWDGKSSVIMNDKKLTDNKIQLPALVPNDDIIKTPQNKKDLLMIKSRKINEYLKKEKNKSDYKDIEIPYGPVGYLNPNLKIIGVGKKGEIYIWHEVGTERMGYNDEKILVYSPAGVLITTINLENSEIARAGTGDFFFEVSPNGELYQMWESKDGVHIYKWDSN